MTNKTFIGDNYLNKEREERKEEDIHVICIYTYMNVCIKYNISLMGEERYGKG